MVKLKFHDNKRIEEQNKEIRVVLKPRCETVVKLPTRSKELETGIVDQPEVVLGVIIAGTLTVVREGNCLTSIVNMSDKEIEITMPTVNLEHREAETTLIGTVNAQDRIDGRMRELKRKDQNGPSERRREEIRVTNL
jgi:hypothetical protein